MSDQMIIDYNSLNLVLLLKIDFVNRLSSTSSRGSNYRLYLYFLPVKNCYFRYEGLF